MKKALLVERNAKLEQLYYLNLRVYAGIDLEVARTPQEVLITLNESQYDLIIVRGILEGKNLLTFVQEKNKNNIPLIVIGPTKGSPKDVLAHIEGGLDLKAVVQQSAKALNITAQSMANEKVPDYFSIPVHFMNYISYAPVELYLEKDNELIKSFTPKEKITREKVKEIVNLSHTSFYSHKNDRLRIVNHISSELIALLEESELSKKEQLQAAESNFHLAKQKLQDIGVDEETIALSTKNLEKVKQNAQSYPSIKSLIDNLLNNQSSFLFTHTQILTYVASHIIKNLDWGNDEQLEKVAFIAFFHDIALRTDEQAQIRSTKQLKESGLSIVEQKIVEKHAQVASEIVQRVPRSPIGADQIIRQHHGSLNGIGFSEHYTANLSPVAIVMIVAEEFTHFTLNNQDDVLPVKEIIGEMKKTFETARFAKILKTLEKIVY